MKGRRKEDLLWEARAVVMWTVPEQPRMLECPLMISSTLISNLPVVHEAVMSEEARRGLEDDGTEADDE